MVWRSVHRTTDCHGNGTAQRLLACFLRPTPADVTKLSGGTTASYMPEPMTVCVAVPQWVSVVFRRAWAVPKVVDTHIASYDGAGTGIGSTDPTGCEWPFMARFALRSHVAASCVVCAFVGLPAWCQPPDHQPAIRLACQPASQPVVRASRSTCQSSRPAS